MPASGRYLLDTNIVIALLEGDDHVWSSVGDAPEVFIPVAVPGELFFGAAKSGRPAENTARIENLATGRSILACDVQIAREYGRVRQELREKGRPIPENDIWIAATARCHDLILVTRDRHFTEVDGLEIATW
jgi:tRNA(fMet)-specific endonuclease VapC